ncbi:ATP-binding protein [Streptomyces acidiscabies]|uniref:ATP-binding protein n=1 Tax=Streptomyces acidiscabies TaxID=42234 RepID=UPI00273E8867|nr:ATP-binding protein [Streptomyces acidiscabies]
MNIATPQLPDITHFRPTAVVPAPGCSPGPAQTERIEQVVAELASNAALHGRVQGRDFRIGLALDKPTGILRAALTDARGDRLPWPQPNPDGLVFVAALADRWGTIPYPPSGKTVWAEFDLRQSTR